MKSRREPEVARTPPPTFVPLSRLGGAVPLSYLSRHPNFQPRNNALILLIIKPKNNCELPSCLIS